MFGGGIFKREAIAAVNVCALLFMGTKYRKLTVT